MSLNIYRDQAGEFLSAIDKMNRPISEILKMLRDEFDLLEESTEDDSGFRHQIYETGFSTASLSEKNERIQILAKLLDVLVRYNKI